MALKNIDLFNELDNLLAKLPQEVIEGNKELSEYVDNCNAIESDNIPNSYYSSIDNEKYLKELISIAKELSK